MNEKIQRLIGEQVCITTISHDLHGELSGFDGTFIIIEQEGSKFVFIPLVNVEFMHKQ